MQRHTPISIEQKTALRTRHQLQPNLSNRDLQQWFLATYNQNISPSSISEILSSQYRHLDQPYARPSYTKRYHREQWPELESALYEWIQ